MKKSHLLLMIAFVFGTALFYSCEEDPVEVIPDAPSVTAPSATTGVEAGASAEVTFEVNVPGGYASSSATAQGGTATISSEPETGANAGSVVVNFTAGTAGGAASVTLTITDANMKSDNATAVLSIAEELNVISVSENITANVTWETGKTYILETRIAVEAGATLTIEPGVVVKGEAGTGANASALIIARGADIMAEGTEESPIIFTSIADEIEPGEIESPNLDPDLNGLWGGLLVLGEAPISADETPFQIEGIPASDTNGLYGGTKADDNSGVLKYISIRHGGANIGEGNEINGLTLGGVGSETVIEHVEIIANQDDGIECFGGTVNVKNIIVWNQGDDAYDMDQAYSGTIDNFIYIGGETSDHGMELDGPEGAATGTYTLKNGSLKGWHDEGKDGGEYADLRDGVTCNIENCYFFNFSESSDFEFDAGDDDADASIGENYLDGAVTLVGLEFNTSHLTAGNRTIEAIFSDKMDGRNVFETQAPDASIVSSGTVGADKSVFANWTWADANGELADF